MVGATHAGSDATAQPSSKSHSIHDRPVRDVPHQLRRHTRVVRHDHARFQGLLDEARCRGAVLDVDPKPFPQRVVGHELAIDVLETHLGPARTPRFYVMSHQWCF